MLLVFALTEDVTPDLFAAKAALACARAYALRPGERVLLPYDPRKSFEVSDKPMQPIWAPA